MLPPPRRCRTCSSSALVHFVAAERSKAAAQSQRLVIEAIIDRWPLYTDRDPDERHIISAWRSEPHERRYFWDHLED
jgi:hypothetical protein